MVACLFWEVMRHARYYQTIFKGGKHFRHKTSEVESLDGGYDNEKAESFCGHSQADR